jgi:pyrroline-5-carboxylate reductase
MPLTGLRIAVIGGGRMGEALIKGLLRAGISPDTIIVSELDATRLTAVTSAHNVLAADSNIAAATAGDVIILAVKPQYIGDVAAEISTAAGESKTIISIAAGVSSASLESKMGAGARVVRVMPNSPAEKGAGMAAISRGTNADEIDIARACAVFSAVGLAVVIDEKLQNAATAVSGSGPAYFFLFVKALADAGEANGLDAETAFKLAHETMFGASRMLKYSKKTPAELIEGVRSPGGTTAAALDVFAESGLEEIVRKAVDAAVARADELGK